MIRNVHERKIDASAGTIGTLIDSLASDDDRLWPHREWPPMKLDRPLGIGAIGGHGPVRYAVEAYEVGRSVTFGFLRPTGFHGRHTFRVADVDGESCTLRHELVMTVSGAARLTWPLFFRPLHDALIEESLDRAESSVGRPPGAPATRSVWTRSLRSMFAIVRRRSRGR